MISYLRKKQVLLLPDKYILCKWTKNAKVGYCGDPTSGLRTDEYLSTSLMAQYGLLVHKASLIVNDTALTVSRSIFLMGEFETLHLQVKEIDDTGNNGSSINKTINRKDRHTIHVPPNVRGKGSGKRLKSSKEKAIEKGNRQCRICGHNGHDKRTCPKLNKRSNTYTYPQGENDNAGTRDDVRDYGTFTSHANSHYDVVNWFL
ncbi:Protein FAR1-RELATED SEQUENCE [Abeliophyllum distichum]|uniref:Protein FAR1-RELATED SEQUENCE n=1 Tax=Abeliophyllum distichum TaxID=126358 RepID=A0ABD1V4R6_9LAMI